MALHGSLYFQCHRALQEDPGYHAQEISSLSSCCYLKHNTLVQMYYAAGMLDMLLPHMGSFQASYSC